MPTINNNGATIYYDVHGQGAPVVLLHGFTASSSQWKYSGILAELAKAHQVIVIDLRGHGKSSKPHDAEAYSLMHRLSDIKAVLDALNLARVQYLGYSMGGWLAFGMAAHYPETVKSLIVGGAHPFDEPATPFRSVSGDDPEAFLHALEAFIGEPIAEAAKPIVIQNDLRALTAAAVDRHDLSESLRQASFPLFLFVGEFDKRVEAVKRTADLCNGVLLVLPDTGHAMTLFSGPSLAQAIRKFCGNAA